MFKELNQIQWMFKDKQLIEIELNLIQCLNVWVF